jgi:hypothetical protein
MSRRPAPPLTADRAQARRDRRTEVARELRVAIDENDAPVADLAFGLDLGETHLRRCADTRAIAQATIDLADAGGLPPALRVRLARWLAGPGHQVVEEPPLERCEIDDLELAIDAQRETSEAMTKHLEAVRRGHATRAQGAELEREADEAICALLRIREWARAAKSEGVAGARRRGLRSIDGQGGDGT